MHLKKLTGFLLGVLVVSMASMAWAGIPDLTLSSATAGASGASVFCLPNGQGNSFDLAKDGSGNTVDATIHLTLLDSNGDPIALYPFEDLWLQTSANGLVACANGTAADASTDAAGLTQWQNPLFAGGNSGGETVNVYVAGSPLNHPGMNILFNSADIDGSLTVNLGDVTLFADLYNNSPNAFDGDFYYDGVINLGDITLMAFGNGTMCP